MICFSKLSKYFGNRFGLGTGTRKNYPPPILSRIYPGMIRTALKNSEKRKKHKRKYVFDILKIVFQLFSVFRVFRCLR